MHIDLMYANRLGSLVRNFKQKDKYLFSFSCPICGDSKKNKLKARGYVYERSNKLFYRCHNCQVSLSFKNFLKNISPELFKEYNRDKFNDRNVPERKRGVLKKKREAFKMEAPVFSVLNKLQKLSELPEDHIAVQYVTRRKIPRKFYGELYFAEKFQEWTNTIIADKFSEESMQYDCSRIVLPFYNRDKKLIGYQGRALDNHKVRYYTIKIEKDEEMIFGMERVNLDETVYVLEGPIDSFFIDNAIAGACSSLPKLDNCILIYDNEKRNREICKQMKNSIKEGYKIFIWPSNIQEKDLNDLYLTGVDIQEMVDENSFSGLMALNKFSQWRKI